MEDNKREYYPHQHRAWRWIIGILIVLIAFLVGFKAGEFCTLIRSEYGYGYPMMGYGMMGGYGNPYYGYGGVQPQVPQNSTATPTPYYYGPGGMMRGYYPSQATSTR